MKQLFKPISARADSVVMSRIEFVTTAVGNDDIKTTFLLRI